MHSPSFAHLPELQHTIHQFSALFCAHLTIPHEIWIDKENSIWSVKFNFMAICLMEQASQKQCIGKQRLAMSQHTTTITSIYRLWQCQQTRTTKQVKRLAEFSERRVHLTSLGRWRKWFDCRMEGTLSLASCFDWSESPGRWIGTTFICHILMTSNLFKFSLYSWLLLISPCGPDPGDCRAEIGLFL